MSNFIQKAFGELEHVVWPTKKETRKYMSYTMSIIVIMTIVLSVLGYTFRFILDQTKYAVNPESRNAAANLQLQQEQAQEQSLQDTYSQFGLEVPQATPTTPEATATPTTVKTDSPVQAEAHPEATTATGS